MPLLPHNTVLGTLSIVEVYEYHDIPCLFACESASGQKYLAVWTAEGAQANTWLYAPMSRIRYEYVRSGGLDLRSAFASAEDSLVFRVIVPKAEGACTIERVPCERLGDDELPAAGQCLDLETATLEALERSAISRTANSANREVLVVEFPPTARRTEMSAWLLGQALTDIQGCLDAFGQVRAGQATSRAPIPQDIRRRTQVLVRRAVAASFGLELIAAEPANLFDESLVRQAIQAFVDLLRAKGDAAAIQRHLRPLRVRSAQRYRVLLSHLASEGLDMKVAWASPGTAERVETEMPARVAREAIGVVEELESTIAEPFTIRGGFFLWDARQRRFGIQDREGHEDYTGRQGESIQQDYVVNMEEEFQVTIRERVQVSRTTGEEKSSYELVSVEPIK